MNRCRTGLTVAEYIRWLYATKKDLSELDASEYSPSQPACSSYCRLGGMG